MAALAASVRDRLTDAVAAEWRAWYQPLAAELGPDALVLPVAELGPDAPAA